MIEGTSYSIAFPQFARLFRFGESDLGRERLHVANPWPKEETEFMYPQNEDNMQGRLHTFTPSTRF